MVNENLTSTFSINETSGISEASSIRSNRVVDLLFFHVLKRVLMSKHDLFVNNNNNNI